MINKTMTMKMKRNVYKKAYLHALANVRLVMTATITGDRIKRKNSSDTTGIKYTVFLQIFLQKKAEQTRASSKTLMLMTDAKPTTGYWPSVVLLLRINNRRFATSGFFREAEKIQTCST